ncbi:hypothetical protein HMPREF3115_21435 [Burkholderia sp. HMSC10F09]|nr:hypothetical protein HMPREF3115_21435 [Burkholderia sp. HMSC10F09]
MIACSVGRERETKGERRFTGFDDKIIAMYARGMSVREIQGFLLEMYGIEVSPDFISTVTDAVIDEVREWQQRPLEPMYPVVFFDALRVKIRDEGVVRRTGNRSQRRSRRSIGHRRPKRPPWRWTRSIRARGVRNTLRLPRSGAGPGIR